MNLYLILMLLMNSFSNLTLNYTIMVHNVFEIKYIIKKMVGLGVNSLSLG